MENKKMIDAFEELTPTQAQKQKIFNQIMTPKRSSIQMKKQTRYAVLGLASCALLAVGTMMAPTELTPTPETPQETSPMGMRKFMTFENQRYAFLEDGKVFELAETPTTSLGELTIDLETSPELSATENFGTTFGLGGTIYEIPNVDPSFRVAVLVDGQYYIAENVSAMDETALDLPTYFAAAKLNEVATTSEVYNHLETTVVKNLSAEETKALLDTVVTATATELTKEQFEAVAAEQVDGQSYLVQVTLTDETTFEFYVLPTLDLVSVGDHYYSVTLN